MSTVITNRGLWERDTSGRRTTNYTKAQGDQGTVSVWYEGIQYTFGPGESKTIADDGIANALIAADGRLVLADTREGFRTKGRS